MYRGFVVGEGSINVSAIHMSCTHAGTPFSHLRFLTGVHASHPIGAFQPVKHVCLSVQAPESVCILFPKHSASWTMYRKTSSQTCVHSVPDVAFMALIFNVFDHGLQVECMKLKALAGLRLRSAQIRTPPRCRPSCPLCPLTSSHSSLARRSVLPAHVALLVSFVHANSIP